MRFAGAVGCVLMVMGHGHREGWNTGICPTISRMTVTLLTSQSAPTATDADALVIGVFQGPDGPVPAPDIDGIDLMAALTALGKISAKAAPGPVVVTVFGGAIADYQKLVTSLRNAGIRAELYLGNPKHSLGQQMKYADRRGSPCAIIQGSDEKARGEVLIKDLIIGAEIAGATAEREDYLKKQAEAQFAVKEERLVEEVRKLLARHGIH